MQSHAVTPSMDSDEIRVADILAFFAETWRTIALGALMAGLLGLAYAYLAPPKYKASVVVQLGKVANADVEAPALVLEKVLVPSFFTPATLAVCGVDSATEGLDSMAKIITPTLSKTSALLALSVLRPSVQEAQNCLEAVLRDIQRAQNKVAQDMVQQKRTILANLRHKADAAEQVLRLYPENLKQYKLADERFSGSVFLHAMLMTKQAELSELRSQISNLELALMEPQTSEAAFATPIYAPPVPAGPAKTVLVALAMLLGAALAFAICLVHRALLHASKEASSGSA